MRARVRQSGGEREGEPQRESEGELVSPPPPPPPPPAAPLRPPAVRQEPDGGDEAPLNSGVTHEPTWTVNGFKAADWTGDPHAGPVHAGVLVAQLRQLRRSAAADGAESRRHGCESHSCCSAPCCGELGRGEHPPSAAAGAFARHSSPQRNMWLRGDARSSAAPLREIIDSTAAGGRRDAGA